MLQLATTTLNDTFSYFFDSSAWILGPGCTMYPAGSQTGRVWPRAANLRFDATPWGFLGFWDAKHQGVPILKFISCE